MNRELIEALDVLEKEKGVRKDVILTAIETSLLQACLRHFGRNDNFSATVNPQTGDYKVIASKKVVETVEDPITEISLEKAKEINAKYQLDDVVPIEIKSKEFSRIATSNAKSIILQKIREEEKNTLYSQFYAREKDLITGIVQRIDEKNNVYVNLGKVDAVLTEKEQVKNEIFSPTDRVKLYIVEVRNETKGPKVVVSRSHPELVKRLFESEVTEVRDGVVEIKSIAREAGSRTKIAVWSNDPNVDPVGACVGLNGARVNSIVQELHGEKIDVVPWSESPAVLIENALGPAKVVSVMADDEEKSAEVVVPDYQLSLAIGKEGQNARLAARLTGFRIDIKSESQVRDDEEDYPEYMDDEITSEDME